jgi:hypothetical protein
MILFNDLAVDCGAVGSGIFEPKNALGRALAAEFGALPLLVYLAYNVIQRIVMIIL